MCVSKINVFSEELTVSQVSLERSLSAFLKALSLDSPASHHRFWKNKGLAINRIKNLNKIKRITRNGVFWFHISFEFLPFPLMQQLLARARCWSQGLNHLQNCLKFLNSEPSENHMEKGLRTKYYSYSKITTIPANIYLFKVNSRNIGKWCEICSESMTLFWCIYC